MVCKKYIVLINICVRTSFNPLTLRRTQVSLIPKFQFYFKKGSSKKNSYERRAYESLDEKSILGYVPKNDEKNEIGP